MLPAGYGNITKLILALFVEDTRFKKQHPNITIF